VKARHIQKLSNEYIRSIIVVSDISSAIPQFISSTLDTITMMCNVPGVTLMKYTVQMWSNTTKTWRTTQARYYRVHDKLVETDLGRRAVNKLVALKSSNIHQPQDDLKEAKAAPKP
jgi:hypothetical protein